MVRAVGAICALLVLSVLGCGGGSDSSSTISYRPFHFPREPGGLQGRDAEVFLELLNKNGLAGSEPTPVFPKGPPPEFVVFVELLDGSNTPYARPGEKVTAQYVAALYDSKKKVASSWDEGKPFVFTAGGGELMEGLEEGVEKIELADRREVVVPAEFATGGSRMKDIPRNTDLIFLVEVLKIEKQSGEGDSP